MLGVVVDGSGSDAWAVGYHEHGLKDIIIAERWDGIDWTLP